MVEHVVMFIMRRMVLMVDQSIRINQRYQEKLKTISMHSLETTILSIFILIYLKENIQKYHIVTGHTGTNVMDVKIMHQKVHASKYKRIHSLNKRAYLTLSKRKHLKILTQIH